MPDIEKLYQERLTRYYTAMRNGKPDRVSGLGCIVTGEKGKMEINRHKISSNPKTIAASLPEESKNTRSETVYHVENWVDCIKTGQKCNADIEYGQR